MQKHIHDVVCIQVQGRRCVVWSVGLHVLGFRVSCFTFRLGVLSSSRTYQFLKIGYEIQAVLTRGGTCSGDSGSHAHKHYTRPGRSYQIMGPYCAGDPKKGHSISNCSPSTPARAFQANSVFCKEPKPLTTPQRRSTKPKCQPVVHWLFKVGS